MGWAKWCLQSCYQRSKTSCFFCWWSYQRACGPVTSGKPFSNVIVSFELFVNQFHYLCYFLWIPALLSVNVSPSLIVPNLCRNHVDDYESSPCRTDVCQECELLCSGSDPCLCQISHSLQLFLSCQACKPLGWSVELFHSLFKSLFLGDSTNLHEKIFHYSQLTAAVLFPISFILAPSAVCVSTWNRFWNVGTYRLHHVCSLSSAWMHWYESCVEWLLWTCTVMDECW